MPAVSRCDLSSSVLSIWCTCCSVFGFRFRFDVDDRNDGVIMFNEMLGWLL